MTTFAGALAAVRSRLTDTSITISLLWQGERPNIPRADNGAAMSFGFIELEVYSAEIVAFGGGAGANIHRNFATVNAYVFVPNEAGLTLAATYAEAIATRLRSFRDSDISCFDAALHPVARGENLAPPGLSRADVGNYQCVIVAVSMFFDQAG
jgi:hypothetical protein